MRKTGFIFILAITCGLAFSQAQDAPPTTPKALKTYHEAMDSLNHHAMISALEGFKSADKQDGGRCGACQQQIIAIAIRVGDWKAAQLAASERINEVGDPKSAADAHYVLGIILMDEGLYRHKPEPFERAHDEMTKALSADPNFAQAVFEDGIALAHAGQDEAARAQFQKYMGIAPATDPKWRRAQRFIRDPELARGRMAPAFSATTIDGQNVSLDDLQGKVVLIDFWATWCPPCREALPHIQEIARKFQGQPLVILSVSLDKDEKKWREFVAHHEMTWLNCRDGGFDGPLATLFDVKAIPHTFTVDADGVIQSEAVGDSSLQGKLKKLLAKAAETASPTKSEQ